MDDVRVASILCIRCDPMKKLWNKRKVSVSKKCYNVHPSLSVRISGGDGDMSCVNNSLAQQTRKIALFT